MSQDPGPSPAPADEPLVASSVSLPEITGKALVLGVLLSVILAGANAYLGLFAGMTVSASIPAAVMSMAVLRLFRRSNILENNLVQTAASAGESVAAGVIFTVPALVLMGYWETFDYWEVTAIAGVGGVVGTLFSIPLRRALVVEQKLRFPEGVATAEVLKSGGVIRGGGTTLPEELRRVGADEATQKRSIRALALAGIAGAAMKFAESGMLLWSGTWAWGGRALGTLWVLGVNLSPALISVGYIVGLNIATLIFLGGAVAWLVAIPIYVWQTGMPTGDAVSAANAIWSSQIRYMGVGAMVVGGLYALVRLIEPVRVGIVSGLQAYRDSRSGAGPAIERTARDAPMNWVLLATALSAIPIFLVYQFVVADPFIAAVMAVVMLVSGFFFAAVAGYMAGLVGSSNNPISGVTIATLLFTSLLLLFLGTSSEVGPAAAILVGAVVACAAAISGDTMQDLKAGYILGATPWRQQVMELLGVVTAAFVMAPVLFLLQARYGIGAPTPEHPNPLTAPQATLMSSVATGVFRGGLPWAMVIIGMVIAVAIVILDRWLEAREASFRAPVLAVAVGIYLPLELSTSIFLGGLVWWLAERRMKVRGGKQSMAGLLLASGLITGEALVGILLAVPIVLSGWSAAFGADMFQVFDAPPLGGWPGLLVMVALAYWLYRTAVREE